MKDALLSLLEVLGLAYWVRISTDSPQCIYYFGPFSSKAEAEAHSGGYCEDLRAEKARGISMTIERCKPRELTVTEDWGELGPVGRALATAA